MQNIVFYDTQFVQAVSNKIINIYYTQINRFHKIVGLISTLTFQLAQKQTNSCYTFEKGYKTYNSLHTWTRKICRRVTNIVQQKQSNIENRHNELKINKL